MNEKLLRNIKDDGTIILHKIQEAYEEWVHSLKESLVRLIILLKSCLQTCIGVNMSTLDVILAFSNK